MTMRSINPATGEEGPTFPTWSESQIESALRDTAEATPDWGASPFGARAESLHQVAGLLRERQPELSRLMSLEMGKLIGEAEAEVEKCAWVCDYYAEHGKAFLADETVESDASRSLVVFQPLGTLELPALATFPVCRTGAGRGQHGPAEARLQRPPVRPRHRRGLARCGTASGCLSHATHLRRADGEGDRLPRRARGQPHRQ